MLLQINYSKFIPPKLNSHYAIRQRLMDRLTSANDHTYTLLHAPEGYGKSSLLSDWYSQVSKDDTASVMWFKVDAHDASIGYFWDNFIEMLDRGWPGIKEGTEEHIALTEQPSFSRMIIILANYIVQYSDPDIHYTIIFDDFHHLIRTDAENLFFIFAEMLPTNVNILISSKELLTHESLDSDVYSSVLTIGVSEIAMTKEEIADLLVSETGEEVPDNLVDRLWLKTEGWPLAIYLLLEQLQAGKELARAIEDFSGNDQLLSDAIFRRVTKELPQQVMMFLLETSFLECFNAQLCNHVCENQEAQGIIQHLERVGAFTFADDATHTWYHYHYLFAEWLRSQALCLHRDQIRDLNHRASSWCRENNRKLLSAKHAVAASEGDFLVGLAKRVFFRSRITKNRLLPWILRLKEQELEEEPYFCLLASWAYAFSGRPYDARHWLALTELHISSGQTDSAGSRRSGYHDTDGRIQPTDNIVERFELAKDAIEAKCFTLGGDPKKGIESSMRLLREVNPMIDDVPRMVLYQNLGEAFELNGLLDKANKNYQKAMTTARANEFEFLASFSRYQIVKVAYAQGKMSEAESLCRVALLECPPDFTVYGALYSALGLVGIMQNRYDELDMIFKRAFARLSPNRNIDMYLDACVARGLHLMAFKNYSEALFQFALARQAIAAHKDVPPRGAATLVYSHQAQLYLKLGDVESAEGMVAEFEALGFPRTSEGNLQRKIFEGRLALEKDEVDEETVAHLEEAAQTALEQKYILLLIEIDLLLMSQYYHLKRNSDAIRYLRKALDRSKKEQIIKPFLDEGDVVRLLLIELVGSRNSGYETDRFSRTLIAAFDSGATETGEARTGSEWGGRDVREDEPSFVDHWGLTNREAEVLKLLSRGMNRKEIASELCTSQNTVKTHIAHIYEKMDVHSVSELLRKMMEVEVL